jgi:hypothetical protein
VEVVADLSNLGRDLSQVKLMSISTNCPECLASLDIPDSLAGKTVKCKECAALVKVPGGKGRQREEEEEEKEGEEEMSEDRPRKKRPRDAEDRSRSRRRAKSDGPSPVLLAGVVFIVIMVVGVAVGIIVVAKSKSNRNGADPVANGGGSDTTPRPAPDRSITPIIPPIDTTRMKPEIPIPVVIRPPLPAGWVDFQHPQKEYSVYVPNKPILRERVTQKPPSNVTAISNGVYVEESWSPKTTLERPISYGMSKMTGPQSGLQTYYNSLTSRTGANSLGPKNKVQVKPVTWAGRQALEMEIESETIGTESGLPGARKNKSYSRHAMVGDKIYMFEVHENIGAILTETDRLAFFDSVVFGR